MLKFIPAIGVKSSCCHENCCANPRQLHVLPVQRSQAFLIDDNSIDDAQRSVPGLAPNRAILLYCTPGLHLRFLLALIEHTELLGEILCFPTGFL